MNDEYEDCPICVERRRKKSWITCPKCQFSCCRGCVKKFLLNSLDINPKCMETKCNAQWDFEFLAKNTDSKFHNSEYRDYRAKIAMERERSLLPATQHLAARELRKRATLEKFSDIEKEINAKRMEINALLNEKRKARRFVYQDIDEGETEEEKKKVVLRFIGHCPENDCKGFLNETYICGLCEKKACRKCRLQKHEGKCDKNTLETVRLLAKDTKHCPNCSVPIFKISGCSQMYCMSCHTAFDWDTGKIETGVIHNPHYYEWARRNGGVPRANREVRCGGRVDINELEDVLTAEHIDTATWNWIENVYRMSAHIRDVLLPRYPNNIEIGNNQDLRVSFLLGEMDEKKWISLLKKREKKREKDRAIHFILRMFCDTIDDLIGNMCTDRKKIPETLIQISELRTYVNKNLEEVKERFDNKVPHITGSFDVR